MKRTIRVYEELPRIDVRTRVSDIPSGHLVSTEFRLAGTPLGQVRGIPYGFSDRQTGGGVHPAIRWSAVDLPGGGGLALLDRGVPGREIAGDTLILPLLNAHEAYRGKPNPWLSGRGEHQFEYAFVPLESDWREAAIPLRAMELNAPPFAQLVATGGRAVASPRSWVRTSENVILESVRSVGHEVEIRLVEWPGRGGTVDLEIGLPFSAAYLTDAHGEHRQPLGAGGSLQFDVRPQQIVTLRLQVAASVSEAPPLESFRSLVPPEKAGSLELRHFQSGHPPE